MSADNMICIQKRLDGRWWVWMDFASEDEYTPVGKERVQHFSTKRDARIFASGWLHGESIVEYGINVLPPQEPFSRAEPMSTLELFEQYSAEHYKPPFPAEYQPILELLKKDPVCIKTEESGGSNE